MNTKTILTLSMGFLLALASANLSAQNTSSAGETNSKHAVKNPDVLIVTGKIIDATTNEPITNAKINFEKFGDEMLQASIDEKGNYALALNKKELGEPIRVIFKVAGYKHYIIKNIGKARTYLNADIFLQPNDSDEKSNADVKYTMSDDPFNTMVIKMQ